MPALNEDPIFILKQWLKTAKEHPSVKEPTAMTLSTIRFVPTWFSMTKSSFDPVSFFRPNSRVVLLKEIQKDQLIFYTNYNSPKARELLLSPTIKTYLFRVSTNETALNFFWPELGRQIRLLGTAKKISREESAAYWESRPRESQISQYISKQSEKLESRQVLEKQWQDTEKQFAGKKIPCPPHWGGCAVNPYFIEFWTEKSHRLHDRLQFKKKKTGFFKKQFKWEKNLIYP